MNETDLVKLPAMPDKNMDGDEKYLQEYYEATQNGERTYVGYAEILRAIADGKRVEWLGWDDKWIYQHPSHTLNDIKGILQSPDRYRVVESH